METIKAWVGYRGSLHVKPISAAASIIVAASDLDLREAIADNKPPHEKHKELRAALLWAAQYIRENSGRKSRTGES